jgi:hypothetical protein
MQTASFCGRIKTINLICNVLIYGRFEIELFILHYCGLITEILLQNNFCYDIIIWSVQYRDAVTNK